MGFIQGFIDYFLRDELFQVATAVVFGGVFQPLITSAIQDITFPLISYLFNTKTSSLDTLNYHKIAYGTFLKHLTIFIITIIVLYFVFIVPLQSIIEEKREKKEAKEEQKNKLLKQYLEKGIQEYNYLQDQRSEFAALPPTI